jgi:hypothetical protein
VYKFLLIAGIDFILRLMVQDNQSSPTGEVISITGESGPKTGRTSLSGETAHAIEPPTDIGALVDITAQKTEGIASQRKSKEINHAFLSQSTYPSSSRPPTASRALLSLFSSARCWTLFSIIFVLGM